METEPVRDLCAVCERCCCLDIVLPISMKPEPELLDWLNTRGIKTKVGKFLWAWIDSPCKQIVHDKTVAPADGNTIRCGVWEDRPAICRDLKCGGDIEQHVNNIIALIDPKAMQQDLFDKGEDND